MFLVDYSERMQKKAENFLSKILLGEKYFYTKKSYSLSTDKMNALPHEMLLNILSFINSPKDVANFSLTCKNIHILSNDHSIWNNFLNEFFPDNSIVEKDQAKQIFRELVLARRRDSIQEEEEMIDDAMFYQIVECFSKNTTFFTLY